MTISAHSLFALKTLKSSRIEACETGLHQGKTKVPVRTSSQTGVTEDMLRRLCRRGYVACRGPQAIDASLARAHRTSDWLRRGAVLRVYTITAVGRAEVAKWTIPDGHETMYADLWRKFAHHPDPEERMTKQQILRTVQDHARIDRRRPRRKSEPLSASGRPLGRTYGSGYFARRRAGGIRTLHRKVYQ
jgi:hypothetical protein